MSRCLDVYGVGNALVDIQHTVSTAFLAQLGIEKGVMTLIDEERQQQLLEALEQEPVVCASGGSAANTMIGVARFGGSAYYACQLGQDEWGDFYQKDLAEAGVGSASCSRSPGRTGQCLVFITPDADRTMNTFLGVSSGLGVAQIEEGVIADSRYIYLEGYLVSSDSGFAACVEAQKMARHHQTAVSLTLSDPAVVAFCRERFATLVAGGVDLLFCNDEEARAFTGVSDRDGSCNALSELVPASCITCGADGAILTAAGHRCRVPAVEVEAVDTTGAGDIFAGGVLHGLAAGLDLPSAGKLGAFAAARVVARYGPRIEENLRDAIPHILASAP